MPSIVEILGVF